MPKPNASKLQTIMGITSLVLLFAWAAIVHFTGKGNEGMSSDLWVLLVGGSAWLLPQPLRSLPPTLHGNGPKG